MSPPTTAPTTGTSSSAAFDVCPEHVKLDEPEYRLTSLASVVWCSCASLQQRSAANVRMAASCSASR